MDTITFNKKYNKNNDENFYIDLLDLVNQIRLNEYKNLLKQQTMHDEKTDCVKVKIILNKIKELEKL